MGNLQCDVDHFETLYMDILASLYTLLHDHDQFRLVFNIKPKKK